jgi:hypothetical protein
VSKEEVSDFFIQKFQSSYHCFFMVMTIETFPCGDIDEFSNTNATKKTLLAMKTIKNMCLELYFDLILKRNVNAKRV